VIGKTPLIVLPGFPTSAIFTFHAFVAPLIGARAGLPVEAAHRVAARVLLRDEATRDRIRALGMEPAA